MYDSELHKRLSTMGLLRGGTFGGGGTFDGKILYIT